MEFQIQCPIDGSVEVGLEDIDNVVLNEHSRADITFVCPHCGTEINVTAVVPQFLLTAIEALSSSQEPNAWSGVFVVSGVTGENGESVASADLFTGGVTLGDAEDATIDSYCEYFRRQLAAVDSADDIIAQIDGDPF